MPTRGISIMSAHSRSSLKDCRLSLVDTIWRMVSARILKGEDVEENLRMQKISEEKSAPPVMRRTALATVSQWNKEPK